MVGKRGRVPMPLGNDGDAVVEQRKLQMKIIGWR